MNISYKFENSGFSREEMNSLADDLFGYIEDIKTEVNEEGYDSYESSVELPFDEDYISKSYELADRYDDEAFTKVIVIGIGGSNLGTWAIYSALEAEREMLFADTVDPEGIAELIYEIQDAYENDERVLLVYISKSGSTTESAANFGVLADELSKYEDDLSQNVVVISNEGSKLWKYAERMNYGRLVIPGPVGGRYSVLTSVGIFPLAFAGIDTENLLQGAKDMAKKCLEKDLDENLALQSALAIYLNYKHENKLHNSFIFTKRLAKFGAWYRQLTAESLGKDGLGIMPEISIGTTDLHSVAQFYFDGSVPMFTTFISVENPDYDYKVSDNLGLGELVENIEGKSLKDIMQAILSGVKESYKERNMNFGEITLEDISAYNYGALLQMKMLEVMFLGKLLNINAFDQPAVELYKEATRKILENS
ncbi:hypothetical protein KC909_02580 [Candidatus Dojkabacteria bacterium]|uniref:Glucose-6-phosphate isomerase n=1 Tax=Candidatus Dojkabacteria bacterium TaxID=2099670 RepID=A0A955L5X0_9BACT|nr:hypothetical protein [Candidatus Dojkabacteria bacterium]